MAKLPSKKQAKDNLKDHIEEHDLIARTPKNAEERLKKAQPGVEPECLCPLGRHLEAATVATGGQGRSLNRRPSNSVWFQGRRVLRRLVVEHR